MIRDYLLNGFRIVAFTAMQGGLILMAGSYTGAFHGAGQSQNRLGHLGQLSIDERDTETKKMGAGAILAVLGFGSLLLTVEKYGPPDASVD